jgi:cell division septum initiation protein DivIVA
MKKLLAENEKIEKQLKALRQGLKTQPAAAPKVKPKPAARRKRATKKVQAPASSTQGQPQG